MQGHQIEFLNAELAVASLMIEGWENENKDLQQFVSAMRSLDCRYRSPPQPAVAVGKINWHDYDSELKGLKRGAQKSLDRLESASTIVKSMSEQNIIRLMESFYKEILKKSGQEAAIALVIEVYRTPLHAVVEGLPLPPGTKLEQVLAHDIAHIPGKPFSHAQKPNEYVANGLFAGTCLNGYRPESSSPCESGFLCEEWLRIPFHELVGIQQEAANMAIEQIRVASECDDHKSASEKWQDKAVLFRNLYTLQMKNGAKIDKKGDTVIRSIQYWADKTVQLFPGEHTLNDRWVTLPTVDKLDRPYKAISSAINGRATA